MTTTEIRLGLVGLGAIAVVSQALLIREAMTTLAGSEIAWGSLLCLWLIGAAIGAKIGSGRDRLHLPIARLSLPAIAFSAVFGVAVLRAAPTLSGIHPGEITRPGTVLLVWLVALVPPSIAVGLGFSALGALSGEAAAAYGFECLGAAAGGLIFTFLLAPWGTPVIAGVLLGSAAALGLGPGHRWLGAGLFSLTLGLGVISSTWVADATWRLGLHSGELEDAVETRYQRLEVSRGSSRAVFSDGRLVGTLPPDPYLVLPKSEMLPLIHAGPRRLAVVGGLTDGLVVGLLKPPTERLILIEEDTALIRFLRSGISPEIEEILNDPRVTIVSDDPSRGLSRLEPVDMILLLDGPPTTLRRNRTRTLEFFHLCRSRLKPGGILVANAGVDSTYVGGHSGRLFTTQAATLGQVFANPFAIAGPEVFLVGGVDSSSGPIDSDTLIDRWHLRDPENTPFFDRLIPTLIDPARSEDLTTLIDQIQAPINTVAHPSAVLPAAALAEGRGLHLLVPLLEFLHGTPPWTVPAAIGVSVLGIIAWGLLPGKSRSEPAFAIGFASMTWYLLLLSAWQGTRGAVYSDIGALTAVFMAGMVAGAVWSRRWIDPSRSLLYLLPVGAVLSLAIGTSWPFSHPVPVIPLFLATGGLVTGGAFAGTAATAGAGDDRKGIGRAFSADEAGAALAALIVGVVGLPLVGTSTLATACALACLAAVVGVWRRETMAP